MKKKIIYSVLFLLVLLLLWQHSLLYYGLVQAKGQLRIVWGATPVAELLNSPEVADSTKHKLKLIRKAKEFAITELGLEPTDNYSSMYDQKGEPLMWVVTACEPFRLEAKEWSFPIVGKFSYKGFFQEDMARAMYAELEGQGLDVGLRNPGGWSTLGWFDDPILSNMLLRSDGDLSELIIHELTHGTLFVKDSIAFNENLASFIGEEGAKRFLEREYGNNSAEYISYLHELEDYASFTEHFLRGAKALDTLYKSFTEDMPPEVKRKEKTEVLQQIMTMGDTIHFHDTQRYSNVFERELPNNTYFMSFLRYRSEQNLFVELKETRFNNDLNAMIDYFKSEYPSL